jgi:hypothetical protein
VLLFPFIYQISMKKDYKMQKQQFNLIWRPLRKNYGATDFSATLQLIADDSLSQYWYDSIDVAETAIVFL